MVVPVDLTALFFAGVTAAGVVQVALGAWAVTRFAGRRSPVVSSVLPPSITVLKPLHGDEPLLELALESFFTQDYARFQLVFGVQSPADPAIAVVQSLRRRYPDRDVALVIDSARHGVNHKISNVINMMGAARHDVLVLADSDLHVAPDYLTRLTGELRHPGTGIATTLYAGRPARAGLIGGLGASYISHVFLPGALLARDLGRQDCLGATMAFQRATLKAIGGFEALVDHLADDAVLGRLVRDQGLSVRLATTVPLTTVPETTVRALVQHEMRWARTIRSLAPVGHALSLVQFPIAWALLALLVGGATPWSMGMVGLAWAARAAAALVVDRALFLPGRVRLWSLPLRDVVSVAEILASYCGGTVHWRGQVVPVGRPRYHGARAICRSVEPVMGEG